MMRKSGWVLFATGGMNFVTCSSVASCAAIRGATLPAKFVALLKIQNTSDLAYGEIRHQDCRLILQVIWSPHLFLTSFRLLYYSRDRAA